ncbi:MAG: hypothetical protein GX607_02050 [Myxococcales bacterium]|jgi:hypothetical protein|nr:hypothetical protein [Myxococcales bacterium]
MTDALSVQSKGQWYLLLEDARRRTDEKLAFDPDRTMLKVIRAQLDFMEQCTKGGRNPTKDETDRITLGPIAVKNLEEEDPEYADWLKELDYTFCVTWKTLP